MDKFLNQKRSAENIVYSKSESATNSKKKQKYDI